MKNLFVSCLVFALFTPVFAQSEDMSEDFECRFLSEVRICLDSGRDLEGWFFGNSGPEMEDPYDEYVYTRLQDYPHEGDPIPVEKVKLVVPDGKTSLTADTSGVFYSFIECYPPVEMEPNNFLYVFYQGESAYGQVKICWVEDSSFTHEEIVSFVVGYIDYEIAFSGQRDLKKILSLVERRINLSLRAVNAVTRVKLFLG